MRTTVAMLADAARVESGKLYVHGGAWDSITANSFPTTHPTLALALVLQVEYSEALRDIPILIELLDEDDRAFGPRLEGSVNTGHPPGSVPGKPALVPQAITIPMLKFEAPGGFRFRVSTEGEELASVPFRVNAARGAAATTS